MSHCTGTFVLHNVLFLFILFISAALVYPVSPECEMFLRDVRSRLYPSDPRVMSGVSIDHNTPSHRHSVTPSDDAQLYAVTIRRQIGNTNPPGIIRRKILVRKMFKVSS